MKTIRDQFNAIHPHLVLCISALLALILIMAPWSFMTHAAGSSPHAVDTTSDVSDGSCTDGDCSLRDAIILANTNPGADTIEFNITGCPGGVCTISPTSALPDLSGGDTTINGYSQPGALRATDVSTATLKIVVDGSSAPSANGFRITSLGNKIEGLAIKNFASNGIYINSNNNTISGNYIGTDASGTTDQGNGEDGVRIEEGAKENEIGGHTSAERNIISGNDLNGVSILGTDTISNTVSSNYIGIGADGASDLGNDGDGVSISSGANRNTVGGDSAGERNVISRNKKQGVRMKDSTTERNTVSGNYIGTDPSGLLDMGNVEDGVRIELGAKENTIGGDSTSKRNVISRNKQAGVRIVDSGTDDNEVARNYIGTDPSGTVNLGNSEDGVFIDSGARDNTIGPENKIAHNGRDGVRVNGITTMGNVITRNSIFSNMEGITLLEGANGGILPPQILLTTLGSANIIGTTCSGCTVEIFENADTNGEGKTFIGSSVADFFGNFTLSVVHLSSPFLTATTTNANGTSEFPDVFTSLLRFLFLPQMYKN